MYILPLLSNQHLPSLNLLDIGQTIGRTLQAMAPSASVCDAGLAFAMIEGTRADSFVVRATLFATALAVVAIVTTAPTSSSAEADLAPIKAEITKRHEAAVKRLQDWIKRPSIAAEDRGFPEGLDYMMKLATARQMREREADPDRGKPAVFATLETDAKAIS